MKRTKEEVISEIEKFLMDEGGAYDWDDFLSVPIKNDRELDAIRIECDGLRDKYPPRSNCRQFCSDEGMRRLQELLSGLRGGEDAKT